MSRYVLRSYAIAAVLSLTPVLSAPAGAQAGLNRTYLGGSIGQSKYKDACANLPAGLNCGETDTAWKIFVGHQFHPNFAVEVGFAELGEVNASGVTTGVNVSGSVKATAWDVVAIGSWPMTSQFSLFGRLGAYFGTLEKTGSGSNGAQSVQFNPKDTNTSFTYGLGVRYDMHDNLAARAEWQRYPSVGKNDTGKTDIDLLSLGVLWKFK